MGVYPECGDPETRHIATLRLEEIFGDSGPTSEKVKETARRIRTGIEKISPFIQQATLTVCPKCEDVCCISKHGYYNFEDLVYMHALGLKAPQHEPGREDSDRCQFLSEKGCCMDRAVRPSGCNWYFCSPLLDHMEKMPGYQEFDDSLREVAELWMEMMEEFAKIPELFLEGRR
jgi:hypothetical protein